MVTGEGIRRADIAVADGKVNLVAEDLSSVPAARVIDAGGKYVLPGAIDAHCHPVYTDKIDKMSLCAAYGGITTIIPFIGNVQAWGYTGNTVDIVKRFIADGERLSYLDFAVHGVFTPADEEVFPRAVPELIRMGIFSFKMYMAYSRRGMMVSDEQLLRIMDLAAADGGIAQVHAETGSCIDYLIDRFIAEGKTGPEYFLPSQPNILEAEALSRAATLSAVTRCALYPVHLSTAEVGPVLNHFREMDAAPLFAETCPHYLTLTNDYTVAKGPIAKCGPPLRSKEDSDALWQGLADGAINVIASDSCGISSERKYSGGMSAEGPGEGGRSGDSVNMFEGSFGLNTIEFMVPVIWTHGVNTGRITLPRLVQVLCENPAKIFGLWPQKGTIAPGSDADIAIWDPTLTHTVAGQHGDADFSSFEGFQLTGMPTLVMQRGEVVVDGDSLVRPQGKARFYPGDPNKASYAPNGPELS